MRGTWAKVVHIIIMMALLIVLLARAGPRRSIPRFNAADRPAVPKLFFLLFVPVESDLGPLSDRPGPSHPRAVGYEVPEVEWIYPTEGSTERVTSSQSPERTWRT